MGVYVLTLGVQRMTHQLNFNQQRSDDAHMLQIRMQKIAAEALAKGSGLPPLYWRMARWWFWLGVPAFTAMVAVVALMVFKHIPGVES